MKIAILANIASIHTQRWVFALSEHNNIIHLITLPKLAADKKEFELGYSSLAGLKRVQIHVLPVSAPAGYFLNMPWVRWILASNKPDLLHAHYASGYGTLGRLCQYHPYVLSVWGSDVFAFPDASFFNRRLLIKNLSAADWICSTSHFMAERTYKLCQQLKFLTVTPFGVDTDKFKPPANKPLQCRITIGTVKTLSVAYGIDILIRAFSLVNMRLCNSSALNRQIKLTLLIVGSGNQREALKKLAIELNIEENVTFAGFVEHELVPEYLNQMDVYCAFSRVRESFGVAVLEASSCGIPVVVSNMGGLPEVVQNGVTGFIVASEDIEEAADAITKLVLDPALRRKMGEAGRQYVISQYSWRESIGIMEGVYSQVLESKSW